MTMAHAIIGCDISSRECVASWSGVSGRLRQTQIERTEKNGQKRLGNYGEDQRDREQEELNNRIKMD